ncbi:hypothetical protein [Polycladidibacter stylochi]|uniref:hypothetical protein n=1 Tax=Polycladidibacter stylochi TaxID=1807766 RepID=UPI00082EB60A|nr:hypothetical protein [Pseudovibrio stylochi]
MLRTYGYARIGERCFEVHNWQVRGRVNAIGALVGVNPLSIGLFEANVNADIFTAWIEREFLP